MTQEAIDTRALEIATKTAARFDAHDKFCDERNQEVREALERLQDAITKGFGRQTALWLAMAGTVIVGLMTIVGFFLVRVVNAIN